MFEETVFERDKLYEEVWSEPILKLAQKYSLSDVGLAKRLNGRSTTGMGNPALSLFSIPFLSTLEQKAPQKSDSATDAQTRGDRSWFARASHQE